MTLQHEPGTTIHIEGKIYQVSEHPLAPGMPYGQEGRRAVVYQLLDEDGEKHALKVFKPRFRIPRMVAVSETLESYASLEGMQACKRIVLTGSRHPDLLREFPDLTYAVLMPWVEGSTWQEILLDNQELSPDQYLQIAKAFARLLMTLEEKGLAHCDLSGPNLIIQPGDQPALVDLEEMYGPGFLKPKEVPAGSPGYAHKSAPRGIWAEEADRFAGAILLIEMLGWFDPDVRDTAWGESYFAPKDMQTENKRLDVLRSSLEKYYGSRILDLFDQAWRSDSLRDCPTFAEWAVAIPNMVVKTEKVDAEEKATISEIEEPQSVFDHARELEKQKKDQEALELYQKAILNAPSKLSREIEKRIAELENKLGEEKVEPISERVIVTFPERICLVCMETIPVGQEVCPHCEGKPKSDQERSSVPGGKSLKVTLLGFGVGLIAILGIVLILLGRGGSGPLSSLEIDTQTPTDTTTSTLVPTVTQLPTEIPASTETPIPSQTPTPSLGVGSSLISSKDGMRMMYIPAGAFLMGSEPGHSDTSPVHEVYLDAFWMDEHEVTFGQYQQFMEDTEYMYEACDEDEDHPAACVSWKGAQAYCEWAGRRLPTEAEWEKAARGGLEGKIHPWGDAAPICVPGANNGAQYVNCNGQTIPAMSFSANGYGLFDMAGNVWEWVSDWYDSDYYGTSPVENPQGSAFGRYRVLRGGSWRDNGAPISVDWRGRDYPFDAYYLVIGFRCAASAP